MEVVAEQFKNFKYILTYVDGLENRPSDVESFNKMVQKS